jgi:hypothetical protein
MLRKAFGGGVDSGKSSLSEDPLKPPPEHIAKRFEHYELVTDENGQPVELGRVRWASPTKPSTSICDIR